MEWEWDMKLGRRSPNLYNKKTKNAPHSMYVSPKSELTMEVSRKSLAVFRGSCYLP